MSATLLFGGAGAEATTRQPALTADTQELCHRFTSKKHPAVYAEACRTWTANGKGGYSGEYWIKWRTESFPVEFDVRIDGKIWGMSYQHQYYFNAKFVDFRAYAHDDPDAGDRWY